jgi:hypothetical protein
MQRAWAVCAVQEGSSDTYRSLFLSVGLPRTRLVAWLPSSFIMRSPGAAAYLSPCVCVRRLLARSPLCAIRRSVE